LLGQGKHERRIERVKEPASQEAGRGARPQPSRGGDDPVLPMTEVEKRAIENALRATDGNVPAAAKKLKIGQATGRCCSIALAVAHATAIYRKIKSYKIRV